MVQKMLCLLEAGLGVLCNQHFLEIMACALIPVS